MFDIDELTRLRKAVRDCTRRDATLLSALRREVAPLAGLSRPMRPRGATSISLVASDGGDNRLLFDPFQLMVVRVVDSCGKTLCLDAVSPGQDLSALDRAQFRPDGSPATALGRLMADLRVHPPVLSELCHWMPRPDAPVETRSTDWISIYRDLCEWAALHERLCHRSFATDTLVVRDGLLSTKLFRSKYYRLFRAALGEAIVRIRKEDRRRVFLVGIAKKSRILQRYGMAMALESILPPGEPRYLKIPPALEARAYNWPEQYRGRTPGAEEAAVGDDEGKYGAGELFFARFGERSGDAVRVVEIFSPEGDPVDPDEIFGHLLADAREGFPIPHYPRCLQKAHEQARVADFDMNLLQDELCAAVRDVLPEDRRGLLDEWLLDAELNAAGRST